jgi:hypothetical protein
LQHANHTIPNRSHGYCTDDNARALLAAAMGRKYLSAIRHRAKAMSSAPTTVSVPRPSRCLVVDVLPNQMPVRLSVDTYRRMV